MNQEKKKPVEEKTWMFANVKQVRQDGVGGGGRRFKYTDNSPPSKIASVTELS